MGKFFARLFGKYTCTCGAVYKVTKTETFYPETDRAICEVCGAFIDGWYHAMSHNSYEIISRPGGK